MLTGIPRRTTMACWARRFATAAKDITGTRRVDVDETFPIVEDVDASAPDAGPTPTHVHVKPKPAPAATPCSAAIQGLFTSRTA